MNLVEISVISDCVVLQARGSELLILTNHVAELKNKKESRDFAQYFMFEALLNRSARKLFEAWLRKDKDLWRRIYKTVQELELSPASESDDNAKSDAKKSTEKTPSSKDSKDDDKSTTKKVASKKSDDEDDSDKKNAGTAKKAAPTKEPVKAPAGKPKAKPTVTKVVKKEAPKPSKTASKSKASSLKSVRTKKS